MFTEVLRYTCEFQDNLLCVGLGGVVLRCPLSRRRDLFGLWVRLLHERRLGLPWQVLENLFVRLSGDSAIVAFTDALHDFKFLNSFMWEIKVKNEWCDHTARLTPLLLLELIPLMLPAEQKKREFFSGAALARFGTICSCDCLGVACIVMFNVVFHYFKTFNSLVEAFQMKNERCGDSTVTFTPLCFSSSFS